MASYQYSAVDEYIDGHLDASLEELKRLCAQPSVAAQGAGLSECAELVAGMLHSRGFDAKVMEVPDGPPAVYAERQGSSHNTLICYNHYDVQPAEPLELWDSPAFEPEIRDSKMYARGVSDDKGHIVSRLAAIDALLATNGGELPCNVKFLIEGGEEISSPGIPEFVRQHSDIFKADACIWESGHVDYEGRPEMFLGMRGICYVELRVRTASRDAHSGTGGSVFPNAAWRLVWALNSIKGPDGRIRIPGHYEHVRQPTQRDLELLEALPNEEERIRSTYGLSEFLNGVTGLDFRRQAVFEPTCTICGLTSGYQLEGAKTVLPAYASAKVDFRLVPDQTPEDIFAKLRAHLDAEDFEDVETVFIGGENPAKTSPDNAFVKVSVDAAREVYGKEPTVHPMIGGSGPMYAFIEYLHVPVTNSGIGYPGGLVHAPNEHIRIKDFLTGTKHSARIIGNFGTT